MGISQLLGKAGKGLYQSKLVCYDEIPKWTFGPISIPTPKCPSIAN
jgi:hypothetical protein